MGSTPLKFVSYNLLVLFFGNDFTFEFRMPVSSLFTEISFFYNKAVENNPDFDYESVGHINFESRGTS